ERDVALGGIPPIGVEMTPLLDQHGHLLGTSCTFDDQPSDTRLRPQLRHAARELWTTQRQLRSSDADLRTTNAALKATASRLETAAGRLRASRQAHETLGEQLKAANQALHIASERLRHRTEELKRTASLTEAVLASWQGPDP